MPCCKVLYQQMADSLPQHVQPILPVNAPERNIRRCCSCLAELHGPVITAGFSARLATVTLPQPVQQKYAQRAWHGALFTKKSPTT